MGSSGYKVKPTEIDVSNDISLIDGRYGEIGFVYEGKNKLADFIFDHRFIYVSGGSFNHYKIYEWTKTGLKMFASCDYPIIKSEFLCMAYVIDVYQTAIRISEGKEFSLTSFNCKDWVEKFKTELLY